MEHQWSMREIIKNAGLIIVHFYISSITFLKCTLNTYALFRKYSSKYFVAIRMVLKTGKCLSWLFPEGGKQSLHFFTGSQSCSVMLLWKKGHPNSTNA